jgi:hypothetical protein
MVRSIHPELVHCIYRKSSSQELVHCINRKFSSQELVHCISHELVHCTSGFRPEICLGYGILKTNKFLMKLKKKPSFCLFEGSDSVPMHPLAETLYSIRNSLAVQGVKFIVRQSQFLPRKWHFTSFGKGYRYSVNRTS